MQRARFSLVIISPSVVSILGSLCLAGIILLVSNWDKAQHSRLLNDFFFGPYGINSIVEHSHSSIGGFLDAISAKTDMSNLLLFLMAMTVGLIIYCILQLGSRLLSSSAVSYLDFKVARKSAQSTLKTEIWQKLLVRIASALGWIVYFVVFATWIVPYAILLTTHAHGTAEASAGGWLATISSIGLLAVAIHIHVVFARLLVLHPRLLGSKNFMSLNHYS